MSFHFFAKKVYDADLCFIRDLIEVGAAVASVTSMPISGRIIRKVVESNDLEAKFQEFSENGHYIVEDCYPVAREERMRRASLLLSISDKLPVSLDDNVAITLSALSCVRKMGFSDAEKIQLIKENLLDSKGSDEVDNFLVQRWLNLL